MRNKGNSGFTLIEVIVVIIILGIMATLVLPNILSHPDKARVTAAKSDIRAISNALEIYKLDNYSYPTTSQGLEALVTKPASQPEPKNWNPGGYLKKTPVDPWGNPYKYILPGTHSDYDIYSTGADGKEGGEGYNADINNWDL